LFRMVEGGIEDWERSTYHRPGAPKQKNRSVLMMTRT
jgi:hypothetical protein